MKDKSHGSLLVVDLWWQRFWWHLQWCQFAIPPLIVTCCLDGDSWPAKWLQLWSVWGWNFEANWALLIVIKSVGIIFTLICSRLTFLDETAVTSQHEKIGPKYISRQIPVYVETMKLALLLLMMSGCLVDFVSARAAVGHGCVRGCLMGKVQARNKTHLRKHSSDT